jgi:hypothetical protein
VAENIGRKNQLEILELRGELKLLGQKLDTIKTNDLHHIQKSLDWIHKILWAVGLLVLGQFAVALQSVLWS